MTKFDSPRTEVLYQKSLDGWQTEELGDAGTFGWYGLFLNFHGEDYILHEDSQGFVDSTVYPLGEGESAWECVYCDYEDWLDDNCTGLETCDFH